MLTITAIHQFMTFNEIKKQKQFFEIVAINREKNPHEKVQTRINLHNPLEESEHQLSQYFSISQQSESSWKPPLIPALIQESIEGIKVEGNQCVPRI
jgi:hypothetical protein